MMIRIRWKLTMMILSGVFMVFVFHKERRTGGDIFPVPFSSL
jgi:hypothetical protein